MAEWLRNPEVKLQTGIHGVLLVTAAGAGAPNLGIREGGAATRHNLGYRLRPVCCRHLSGGQRNISLVYRKTI